MTKVISVVLVLVLVIGGLLFFRNRTVAPTDLSTDNLAAGTVEEGSGVQVGPADEPLTSTSTSSVTSPVKEFTVDATNFAFAPKTISVNIGDKVRLNVKNTAGMHDLKIDELGVATKILKAGESEVVEFIATKAGSFEYYCSVGTHRQMGMVGTLTVK